MVNIDTWMEGFLSRLKETFGPRLLFLGLQGSYGRGEANEDSDIDVVCVLDRVDLADLDTYRTLVRGMPEGEKACGFLCGAEELKRWPEYDLCSVVRDTRPLFGSWEGLLPPLGRVDLARGVAIGASGLYHAAVHTYLYGGRERWADFLRKAHKSAFFLLRDCHELRTGEQVRTRRELLPRLGGEEKAILAYGLAPEGEKEAAFARLIAWAGRLLGENFTQE